MFHWYARLFICWKTTALEANIRIIACSGINSAKTEVWPKRAATTIFIIDDVVDSSFSKIQEILTNADHIFLAKGDVFKILTSNQKSRTETYSVYKEITEQILTFEEQDPETFWHLCLINDLNDYSIIKGIGK